jgi:beta-glucosidase
MTPLVTFHHFTNPLWLQQRGSWENVEVVPYFQRFVRYTCAALGDLCNCWVTLNEPLVYVALTYYTGIWPAQRRGFSVGMRVFRNFLLAHGAAYQTIHALQAQAQVGTAFPVRVFTGLRPGNRLDRYAAALKRYLFEQIWLMATADGRIHPPVGLGEYHHSLAGSMDFIGINYYTRDLVRFTPNPLALFGHEQFAPDAELSDQGRFKPYSQYAPDGLEQVVNEIKRFGRPIYITENGLPDRDDDQRPRWLVGHLRALHRAIQAGADVRGYFHWTFTDNFEWHEGWGLRFGLVELDPQTQERRPRPSAYLYAKIARQNGLEE